MDDPHSAAAAKIFTTLPPPGTATAPRRHRLSPPGLYAPYGQPGSPAAALHEMPPLTAPTLACVVRMLRGAVAIRAQNPDGALHIFVADGNASDEDLDFCGAQVACTSEELAFLDEMRADLTPDERAGAWALAQTL